MKEIILVAFFILCSIGVIYANSPQLYDYKIIRVLDGDTIEIEAPFLPSELKQTLKVRLFGIDTPEKGQRSKCSIENSRSLKAKLFLEEEIARAQVIKVVINEWDKYGGRILGDFILDGERLTTKLIRKGFAIHYDGGTKNFDWCR